MQAILTAYHGPTESHNHRISARCECAPRGDAWIARASGDDWTDEINAARAALNH